VTDWPVATLEDLTSETRPICYGVLKPGPREPSGVPLIRIKDMEARSIRTEDLFLISRELDSEFARSRLQGGEVLLSIQGTIGRVSIVPMSLAGANISRTIAVIDPDSRLLGPYLAYYLEMLGSQSRFDAGGATRLSLNIGDLRKVLIPLPPLDEQKRIVAKLDEARKEQVSLREKLDERKALVQSLRDKTLAAAFAGDL